MMKQNHLLAMACAAGLAVSGARAQFAIVTNQPGTFTDISATGAAVTSGDDSSVAFSSSVTNALVTSATLYGSTNGVISNAYFPTYINAQLPVTSLSLGLFAYWDDLFVDPPTGTMVHQGVVENGVNVEIIQWNNIRLYANTGGRGTFQIKIFQSGPVLAQYIYPSVGGLGSGNSATVGVQSGTNSFDQFTFNTGNIAPGTVLSVVQNAAAGACCLPGLTCATTTSSSCASQGGTYRGDGSSCASANCPQPGACCLPNGACVQLSPPNCSGQNGVYRGDNTLCANANCPQPPPPTLGPDVYVGDLTDVFNFGAVGAITAYAVGTNACNLGDAPVQWSAGDNQHPVIAQNMYRLMNGRFEQIGQSWLKHGFASTNSNFCDTCQQPPGGGSQLGVGCSDAYGSGLNGSQGSLGPRSQVNATTGSYPYPFTAPGAAPTIGRRLQVFTTDVIPAQNQGALYFAEGHYVTADDATWNNGLNNASYKQISVPSETASPGFIGGTHQRQPGIQAWKDQDPAVTLVAADYIDSSTPRSITARFWVGARATDNGNGTWHYEYAVYNHNADRSGGSFSVPAPAGVAVSNIGFHAPFSHSGEPYDNSPWAGGAGGGAVLWVPPTMTPAANTNAIHWGTLYNFRFDASTPPTTGLATIGLFTAGSPGSVTAAVPVPGPVCYANCDASTIPPVLTVGDFSCFLQRFAAGDPYANCDGSTITPVLNVADFTCFLGRFAAGCP